MFTFLVHHPFFLLAYSSTLIYDFLPYPTIIFNLTLIFNHILISNIIFIPDLDLISIFTLIPILILQIAIWKDSF